MKSLQTTQKFFKIFQIFRKIVMVIAFGWAGLAIFGVLCGIIWYHGGNVMGVDQELFYSLSKTQGLPEMIAVFLVDTIFALISGILLSFSLRYFNKKQMDQEA